MQRHRIVDAGLHAVGPQPLPHGVSARRPGPRRGGTRARTSSRVCERRDAVHGTREARRTARAATRRASFHSARCGSLASEEAGLQVVQPVAVARRPRAPTWPAPRGCAAAAPCGLPPPTLVTTAPPSPSAPEVLARVEAEGGGDAQRAARPALEGGAVRLTGVLDHREPALARRSARCSPCRPAARRGARAGWPPSAG